MIQLKNIKRTYRLTKNHDKKVKAYAKKKKMRESEVVRKMIEKLIIK